VSPEVKSNTTLAAAVTYDGARLPFGDSSFDGCVSNYVLEHVADPAKHFAEVARVLRPGGVYVTRTPNLFHYVAFVSSVVPHSSHVRLAKTLRGQTAQDHDPWVTHYRANTAGALSTLATGAAFRVATLQLVEKEPSYGRASPLLFFPMMLYERLVNSSDMFCSFRSSIIAAFQKPA
jgi:SAM-dependent methyltransferase